MTTVIVTFPVNAYQLSVELTGLKRPRQKDLPAVRVTGPEAGNRYTVRSEHPNLLHALSYHQANPAVTPKKGKVRRLLGLTHAH